MTSNFQQAFNAFINKHKCLQTNSKVIIAVSGGIDSMVLLDLFRKSNYAIMVAHCNFNLRGNDSIADEQLVATYCKNHQIKFISKSFDIESSASTQVTARNLRYDWFNSLLSSENFDCIATAHHADDQLETILMNLVKGTGVNGLKGISVVNTNLIRPLLFTNKNNISAYAEEQNIHYREDVSNQSDKYLRNKYRLNIIPQLKEINPSITDHIQDFSERMKSAQIIIDKQINNDLKRILKVEDQVTQIDLSRLNLSAYKQTLIYETLKRLDIASNASLKEVLKLCISASGKSITIKGYQCLKYRNHLYFKPTDDKNNIIQINQWKKKIQLVTAELTCKDIPFSKLGEIDKSCIYVDSNKVEFPITFRKFQDGDYFYPYGMKMKKKKLKKFFNDIKINQFEKEQTWIMEDASKRIIWVVGQRMDERFFPKTNTSNPVKKIQIKS
jgi:tRNA(Ile)-lysidine synthase